MTGMPPRWIASPPQAGRKELPQDAAAAVYMLIDAFDSWRKAFAELVIEDFTKSSHLARSFQISRSLWLSGEVLVE
jgi:hypothetical protein